MNIIIRFLCVITNLLFIIELSPGCIFNFGYRLLPDLPLIILLNINSFFHVLHLCLKYEHNFYSMFVCNK